ncbi:sulfite exporter TauE/SafE family protein [Pseudochelatococcus lubricantis]|uniref:sulfite exporter TauE/SafE family protein n=1 Tax=Pseudochelatococcus lubricantis TaxID=1538102 RepID=UPI0035E72E92
MMDISLLLLVAVAATFFAAGIVKGVTGMGLPTVAMGVLGALVSPLAAASLLIVPSFVTNVWQLAAGPSFVPLARRLWPMMLAIVAGTLAGTSLLAHGDTALTTGALGAALVFYAAFTLLARQIRVPAGLEPWLSPAVGAITGIVTGATGVFVIPAVPYLQALGLDRDDLVQALGLSFTVSTVALALGLASRGAFHADSLVLSALAVAPALAGMWAGQIIRQKISPQTFRRWFLLCLLVLGVEMLLRPLVS